MARRVTDFPRGIRDRLRNRVNALCSNPKCIAPTLAKTHSAADFQEGGEAAHITAANPGGPRYDGSLSDRQRSDFDNGIWLCRRCARMIDRDVPGHPVALLRTWKAEAEQRALAEFGRPRERRSDPSETAQTIAAAFTGQSPAPVLSAIPNVHAGIATALERLDPRFRIDTSHSAGRTSFVVRARDKPVDISFTIRSEHAASVVQSLNSLLLDGETAKFPTAAIKLPDSGLFDFIQAASASGEVTISAIPIPTVLRLWFGKDEWRFDDIVGSVTAGARSATFAGGACDGLVSFALRIERGASNPYFGKFSFSPDKWEGLSVDQLPHFETLRELVTRLTKVEPIRVSIVSAGIERAAGTSPGLDAPRDAQSLRAFVEYIAAAQTIATRTKRPIHVRGKKWVDGVEEVLVAAKILSEGRATFTRREIRENPVVGLALETDRLPSELERSESASAGSFRVALPLESLVVFGEVVELPEKLIELEHVWPRVSPDPSTLKRGDDYSVELVLDDQSRVHVSYGK